MLFADMTMKWSALMKNMNLSVLKSLISVQIGLKDVLQIAMLMDSVSEETNASVLKATVVMIA